MERLTARLAATVGKKAGRGPLRVVLVDADPAEAREEERGTVELWIKRKT